MAIGYYEVYTRSLRVHFRGKQVRAGASPSRPMASVDEPSAIQPKWTNRRVMGAESNRATRSYPRETAIACCQYGQHLHTCRIRCLLAAASRYMQIALGFLEDSMRPQIKAVSLPTPIAWYTEWYTLSISGACQPRGSCLRRQAKCVKERCLVADGNRDEIVITLQATYCTRRHLVRTIQYISYR